MLLLAFACAAPAPEVEAPTVHDWATEAALVVEGLEDAERLWNADQKEAARMTVAQVYSERWEPRLEPAMRELAAPGEVVALEYAFGQVGVDMQAGSRERLASRLDDVERRVRAVAEAAARRFPPPGTAVATDAAPAAPDVQRPLVPDVAPNWQKSGP